MSQIRSYDGMRESDALLAIDGEGKWVLRTEAMERIAALEAEVARLREGLLDVRNRVFEKWDNARFDEFLSAIYDRINDSLRPEDIGREK